MTPKARAIVIDPTRIEIEPPAALIGVELWGDAAELRARLPVFGQSAPFDDGWRAIGVEPTVWWLTGPLEDRFSRVAAIAEAVARDGAAIDLTGAVVRFRITGRRWRSLLTIGGIFDAEDPAFANGASVGTILHHVSVRHEVLGEDIVAVHVAPSYADHLHHHLRAAAARLDIGEP